MQMRLATSGRGKKRYESRRDLSEIMFTAKLINAFNAQSRAKGIEGFSQ